MSENTITRRFLQDEAETLLAELPYNTGSAPACRFTAMDTSELALTTLVELRDLYREAAEAAEEAADELAVVVEDRIARLGGN